MKTKKLMKLLMSWSMPRNQARKIVAIARDYGISNDEALSAVCVVMVDTLMDFLKGIEIPVVTFDDIEVDGDEM